MRRINEVGLLDFLRRNGPASRVEIAGKLGLDTKTITNVSRDLLQRKMLETVGLVSRGRGRPREMLRLRAAGIHAIGLHLTEHEIAGAVIGFDGNILLKHQTALGGSDNRKTLVARIRRLARELVRAHPQALGIGLVSPGLWDARERRILRCVHLPGWEGVALDDVFANLWKGPVYFESYTRAKALAEHWFGAARELEDFVVLDAGDGIGCAVFHEGKLQAGYSHMAGEIGHCVVRPGGAPCVCGQRGCLETVASLAVLREQTQRASGRDLRDALTLGQPAAVASVREAAQAIGLLVAYLTNVLNPSHIVLVGETTELGPVFLTPLQETVTACAVPALRDRVQVVRGQLGAVGALLGAGAAALRSVFTA
ncbi:MAG: ROK family transcriptional regulator [Verrucomicrobiae bacterium]|nr:ROK family transcriptional regulator [Verrucomicrobiae bacterium]